MEGGMTIRNIGSLVAHMFDLKFFNCQGGAMLIEC